MITKVVVVVVGKDWTTVVTMTVNLPQSNLADNAEADLARTSSNHSILWSVTQRHRHHHPRPIINQTSCFILGEESSRIVTAMEQWLSEGFVGVIPFLSSKFRTILPRI